MIHNDWWRILPVRGMINAMIAMIEWWLQGNWVLPLVIAPSKGIEPCKAQQQHWWFPFQFDWMLSMIFELCLRSSCKLYTQLGHVPPHVSGRFALKDRFCVLGFQYVQRHRWTSRNQKCLHTARMRFEILLIRHWKWISNWNFQWYWTTFKMDVLNGNLMEVNSWFNIQQCNKAEFGSTVNIIR